MTTFRPDHNGECLNCDEWFDAHGPNGECPSNAPPLRRGDFVTVQGASTTIEAMVVLASSNGRSVMLMFDGAIGPWFGSLPALQDDAGAWRALDGLPLTITRNHERGDD